MYSYYTPKLTKIQAFLAKIHFFVNCDDNLVDIFMLTSKKESEISFIIFNYLSISCVQIAVVILNIDSARNASKKSFR